MADDLSFTISAQDQASAAVETVQKKIQDFGKDIAKMALGIAGPMALLQAGIGLVIDKYKEYQQAKIDARKEKEAELDAIAKAEQDKDMERFKKSAEAYKKAEAEKTAFFKKQEEERKKHLSLREEIKALETELAQGGPLTGPDLLKDLSDKVRDAKREFETTQRNAKEGRTGANYASNVDVDNARIKYLQAQLNFRNAETKQDEQNAKDKAQGVVKPEEVKVAKRASELTVSSLREIGGSFGAGGDINTGIERQVEIAQKQTDILTTIATNTAYLKTDSSGNPMPVGSTNFIDGWQGFSSREELMDALTSYQRR